MCINTILHSIDSFENSEGHHIEEIQSFTHPENIHGQHISPVHFLKSGKFQQAGTIYVSNAESKFPDGSRWVSEGRSS